jgi:glycosyltransferase involved in cell wall biosynthesis
MPLQLALVGDGPQAAALRALADRLGLARVCRFAGFADADKVCRYMQAADLQVCSSEFENHSLAILEAFATGTPVLGTPAGGTPALLEQVDGNLVLPDPRPETIAARIRDLLANPTELRRLRDRARAVAVERYDWARVVSALEAVCREAVSERQTSTSAPRAARSLR